MGTEVTTISESVFRTLPQVELRPPNRALYGPNRKPLSVLAEFEGTPDILTDSVRRQRVKGQSSWIAHNSSITFGVKD